MDDSIDPTTLEEVAGNLAAVKSRILRARREAGLPPAETRIVAVSKQQDPARIRAALAAGHRIFGENRIQEARAKWPDLRRAHPDLELHFIGHLQSNKVDEAVALFDVIETLDREKLARKLAAAMARAGRRVPLFIQVNTGEEPQKGGVLPGDLDALVALARDALGLPVVGLMCIPPRDDDPALHFALLTKLARRHGLAKRSMGMSGDFEIAAAMGADYVRIGTAIFGPRTPPPE